MPSRRDDWLRGRSKDELHYCVICKRYLAPIAWGEHEHNPEVRHPDADRISLLDDLMTDVVYLGGVKVTNCASVLVVQGIEVFRLRDRDSENNIRIDLDLRGPQGKRIAKIADNRVVNVAPGYAFEADGRVCTVYEEASGEPLISVEAVSSKAVQLLGTFWVEKFKVDLGEEGLTLGEAGLPARPVRGRGTAILLRKGAPEIGFAKN